MQVMIDGRSVYLPPVSTVDWADLPITVDDIERIEVIRGPAAASHGANSTQGVINITTRAANGSDGKSLSITRGSKGINDIAARFGKSSEAFDYRMTLAYTADNGYDDLATPPNGMTLASPRANSLLYNSHDSNQARLMNFRADYHPNVRDSFDIQFGFNHDIRAVGWNDKTPSPFNPLNPSTTSTNGNPPHNLNANSGFVQLGWTHLLDTDSELSLLYYHIQQNRYESFPVYLGGAYFAGPVTQSIHTGRDELSLQHTLRTSATNRVVYGAAYRNDQVRGRGYIPPSIPGLSRAYGTDENMDEWRVFAHDEWRITPALLLNSGAMFERDRLGEQNLSPRASLNFQVLPHHTLRFGASVAHRTPALIEEKYPTLQPGEMIVPGATVRSFNLHSEKMVSREIGYLGELPEWSSSIDLRLYSDEISGMIYVRGGQFVNLLAARHQGLEATIKHALDGNSDLSVNFARASAHSDAQTWGIASTLPGNNDAVSASTPRYSASAMYSRRWDNGFNLSANYYYQGALQPMDRGSVDYQPIQRRMDVRVAKSFHDLAGMTGDVALVVQNLLNQDYTEYVANNVFNRRGYVTLTLKW
jgi:iron complex outermembrane receptor protein